MKVKKGNEWLHNVVSEEWTKDMRNATLLFAKSWADRMEAEFVDGKFSAEIALATRHEEIGLLSTPMYCMAVNFLSAFWVFGSSLRVWHNIVMSDGDITLAVDAIVKEEVMGSCN